MKASRACTRRVSSGDQQDIQVKALEEGMSHQTLIASVLHKYVSGRLWERRVEGQSLPSKPKAVRRAGKTDA